MENSVGLGGKFQCAPNAQGSKSPDTWLRDAQIGEFHCMFNGIDAGRLAAAMGEDLPAILIPMRGASTLEGERLPVSLN